MAERRLLTTLKNLALALLNATLILIALCLFLAWQLFTTVEGASEKFAKSLLEVQPLQDELAELTAEGAALRAELKKLHDLPGNLRDGADGLAPETLAPETVARLQKLETRLNTVSTRLDTLAGKPRDLMIDAIDHSATRASEVMTTVMGCRAGVGGS